MTITIYRRKQSADVVNSGFKDWSYDFRPIGDRQSEGQGGGVYGHCWTSGPCQRAEFIVPDGSVLRESEAMGLCLYSPGSDIGREAIEFVADGARVTDWTDCPH